MPSELNTMMVKYADGRLVRINTRDYNPDIHFDLDAPTPEPAPEAPVDVEIENVEEQPKRRGRR